jgi:hypothetical protein
MTICSMVSEAQPAVWLYRQLTSSISGPSEREAAGSYPKLRRSPSHVIFVHFIFSSLPGCNHLYEAIRYAFP